MKTFAEDKFIVTKMPIFLFDRVENFVGRGENAGNHHFLLFPQCFQKVYFQGRLKSGLSGKELTGYQA